MILPSRSQKHSQTYRFEYAGAEKQATEKIGFHHLLSFFFLLLIQTLD